MKKYINKSLYLIAIGVLLAGTQFSFADESFQNNLLKMDVSQSSLGGVKMTLYTNKPYSENVIVNKKSDTEYVILLPETSNSMTASPVLNSVAGVVRGVSVKTQQYDNQAKGYTKITVSTTKPVEISPQVQTLKSADVKLSQQDYDELLEQVAKAKTVTSTKPKGATIASTPVVKKPAPPTFKAAKVLEKLRPSVKAQSAPKLTKIQPTPVQTAKTVSQSAQKLAQVAKPPIEQVQSPQATANTAIPKVEQTIQTQSIEQKVQPELPTATPLPVQPQEGTLAKYIRIIKSNLYMVLGFAAAAFLLLLLGARGMVKNINKQKEIFTDNLQEQPTVVTDYSDKINEEMTWKEKFKTYSDVNQQGASRNTEEEKPNDNKDLDDLFSKKASEVEEADLDFVPENELDEAIFDEEIFNDEIYDEVGEEYYETQSSQVPSALEGFGNVKYDNEEEDEFSLDDLLSEDEDDFIVDEEAPSTSIIFEEEPIEPEIAVSGSVFAQVAEQQQEEIIKSEFVIDSDKGFYLVDFEDASALVGHIEDEIFVLKRFEQKRNEKIQARLDETKENSSNYMTRVGNFKGLVEVTPEKMNLLIEL